MLALAQPMHLFWDWRGSRAALELAAVLVFAIGVGVAGSVTGVRRPRMVPLIVAAVLLNLGMLVLQDLAAVSIQVVYIGGVDPYIVLGVIAVLDGVVVVVGIVFSIIAGIQIGRAGVVPRPWAWLPLPVMVGAFPVAGVLVMGTAMSMVSWMDVLGEWSHTLAIIQMTGGLLLAVTALVLGLFEWRGRSRRDRQRGPVRAGRGALSVDLGEVPRQEGRAGSPG